MNDDARIRGYATGLFEIACAEDDLDRVEVELTQLARVIDSSEELRNVIGDNSVPLDRRTGIIHDLLGGRAGDATVAAVGCILATGRARDLSAIADDLVRVAVASRERQVAEVRTAVPLDDDQVHRLEEALARVTGHQVELKVTVDPDVVGGIVARVGDTVIDGSVRRRLDSLRTALRSN
ncbi:MAG: ATP synthase F1 subunit delta [Acidimicrobiia bacterium]|nr:ATP synthase F1 subunit delta [Acidimicrobiia bacterium]